MTRAYVFPGQGAQTVGMGRELAAAYPAAQAVFDEVDAALGEKLSALIWDGDAETLTLTANAQPALMACSLAVVRALQAEGVAIADGAFVAEIAPVTIAGRKGDVIVDTDEAPGKAMPDKIPTLKPAFAKDGTITAATSSSISDGAAAVVLTRQSVADAKGAKPVARLVAHAAHAQEPKDFTVAPVGAINKVLAKAGWSIGDVDLFEVNEAFACVAMFAMHDLGIPHDKINVNGGATALGHPIGASGTRIITTLIAALQRHGKTRGVASLCIGGGEATALAMEVH